MKRLNSNDLFPYLVGGMAWLLVVYPSLIQVNWFYLDAPWFTTIGRGFFDNYSWLLPDAPGRAIPFFWFYYAATYVFFGHELFWYFFVQSMVTLLTTLLIVYLVRWMSKSNLTAILAVLLYYTSSPLAENVYTIGKQEHLVLFFILLLIFFQFQYIHCKNRVKQRLLQAGGMLCTLLACWSKETGVVIAVYAIVAAGISFVMDKRDGTSIFKTTLYYYAGLVAAVVVSKLPSLFVKQDGASYTSYDINFKLVLNNFKFYVLQQPDVLITGALALGLAGYMFIRKAKSGHELPTLIGLSSMSWAYFAGLLIWRWPVGYYLYAIAALFILVLSTSIGRFKTMAVSKRAIILTLVASIIVGTRIYSIPYNIYIATTQRAAAEIYDDAVKQYVNTAQSGQKLIIENWAFFEEQPAQTNRLINEIYGKQDLVAAGIAEFFNPSLITPVIQKLYRFNEIPDYKARLPKDNDYILVLTANSPSYWLLRCVSPFINQGSLFKSQGMDLKLVSQGRKEARSLYVDVFSKKPVIGKIYFGYELYQVVKSSMVIWNGRYTDGWIGKRASVELPGDGKNEIKFKVVSSDFVETNKLSFWVNGALSKEVKLDKPGEYIIALPIKPTPNSPLKVEVEVEKTFVPKEKNINSDERTLGVIIDLVK